MLTDINRAIAGSVEEHLVYGVLLFTEQDASVVKMLKDPDYFRALDVLSGDKLQLFVSLLFPAKEHYPKAPSIGRLGSVQPIWREPEANTELMGTFEISSRRELPVCVVFTRNSDRFLYEKFPIRAQSSSEMFEQTKTVLETISAEIEKNQSHLDEDRLRTWKNVQWQAQAYRARHTISSVLNSLAFFRGVSGI